MEAEDLIKNLKNSDYKKNCKKINVAWNFEYAQKISRKDKLKKYWFRLHNLNTNKYSFF